MTSQVIFEPIAHTYTVNGVRRPSVTGILKAERFADFSHVPERTADYSMDLGSKIHLATELFDKEELDGDTLDQELVPYLAAYAEWKKETGFEPELIEHRFYNEAYGYCGTLDRTGTFPPNNQFPVRSKAVVDIKRTDGAIRDWVGVQLAAYAMSLKAPLLYRRIALRLSSDGKYQHREFPASGFRKDWNAFQCAVGTYNWKAAAR
jgi:hypothetical protein